MINEDCTWLMWAAAVHGMSEAYFRGLSTKQDTICYRLLRSTLVINKYGDVSVPEVTDAY